MLYFDFLKGLMMSLNSNFMGVSGENAFRSYKNFILLGFAISFLYALCYFIMRVCLAASAFEDFSLFDEKFLPMFVMGFRLDMRAVCVVFAVILLLGYALSACERIFKAINAKNLAFKTNSPNSQNALGGGGIHPKISPRSHHIHAHFCYACKLSHRIKRAC